MSVFALIVGRTRCLYNASDPNGSALEHETLANQWLVDGSHYARADSICYGIHRRQMSADKYKTRT